MKKILLIMTFLLSTSIQAQNFRCHGTEPFWALETSNNFIDINFLETKPYKEQLTKRIFAEGRDRSYASNIHSTNSKLSIIQSECSDGMSDTTYSHHILFETNKKLYTGCCLLK